MKSFLKTFLVVMALGVFLIAPAADASIITFNINQTYSQGGVADLVATTIGIGGAGTFVIDPGFSGDYFDFKRPGGGTFSTIGTQIGGYYFLDSYAAGETIGAGDFGTHVSPVDDWDTILVGGTPAGVWTSSHNGYLGFNTSANLYGWIAYNFTRSGPTSTIAFLGGAYNDIAGADIVAGSTAPVPEPATMLLLGSGLVGLAGFKRKKIKK